MEYRLGTESIIRKQLVRAIILPGIAQLLLVKGLRSKLTQVFVKGTCLVYQKLPQITFRILLKSNYLDVNLRKTDGTINMDTYTKLVDMI